MEKIIEKLEDMVDGMSMKNTLGSALAVAFVSGFCIKLFHFAKDMKFGSLIAWMIVFTLLLSPVIIVLFPFIIGLTVGKMVLKRIPWLGWVIIGLGSAINIFWFVH